MFQEAIWQVSYRAEAGGRVASASERLSVLSIKDAILKNIIKHLHDRKISIYLQLRRIIIRRCGTMDERLSNLYLRNGKNAQQYVLSLNPAYRRIATEAILECSRLGYPLNNMEITSKARELQRKRQRANA
jgi:hypothetical protein